eukprot:gene13334-4689_t
MPPGRRAACGPLCGANLTAQLHARLLGPGRAARAGAFLDSCARHCQFGAVALPTDD